MESFIGYMQGVRFDPAKTCEQPSSGPQNSGKNTSHVITRRRKRELTWKFRDPEYWKGEKKVKCFLPLPKAINSLIWFYAFHANYQNVLQELKETMRWVRDDFVNRSGGEVWDLGNGNLILGSSVVPATYEEHFILCTVGHLSGYSEPNTWISAVLNHRHCTAEGKPRRKRQATDAEIRQWAEKLRMLEALKPEDVNQITLRMGLWDEEDWKEYIKTGWECYRIFTLRDFTLSEEKRLVINKIH